MAWEAKLLLLTLVAVAGQAGKGGQLSRCPCTVLIPSDRQDSLRPVFRTWQDLPGDAALVDRDWNPEAERGQAREFRSRQDFKIDPEKAGAGHSVRQDKRSNSGKSMSTDR